MKKAVPFMFAASVLTMSLSGCVIHVGGGYEDREGAELSSVFGGIDVDSGNRVGSISTVNGGIELENNVTAEILDSVNGGIEMGENVLIERASVVNGDIEAGRNLVVEGSLVTVNGDIRLDDNARINGNIETVNGNIQVLNGEILDDIVTSNGDIRIEGSSTIHGDIVFQRSSNDKWNWGESTPSVLFVGRDVNLLGNIIIQRPVELELENPEMGSKVIHRYSHQ
ncbi:hypothetical protein DXV75_13020 [Alteromonas aestuariivivens]|uniref:Polymer-forming cytoskeletal protein n=1 Tax=Alteromonas aestuariivivens TaxID=1938339 RepID=A0A3D8M4P7_9ALTE|nr:polymer-forming cytoskeletal protein [Alteromonas aestuariivivens]RDV24611.1 hypothetical protein DXV75_13020 [Alteromonas aestuariivivens]